MTLVRALIQSSAAVFAIATLFVVASAGVGEAAKKKAAAPAEPKTSVCFLVHHPVCAMKGTSRQTYTNSCYARLDGAKVLSQGACPAAKAGKKKGKG
jgi:hypothetical protein